MKLILRYLKEAKYDIFYTWLFFFGLALLIGSPQGNISIYKIFLISVGYAIALHLLIVIAISIGMPPDRKSKNK